MCLKLWQQLALKTSELSLTPSLKPLRLADTTFNIAYCTLHWFEQMNFECAYFAIFSRSIQTTTQRRWKLRSCRLYWTEEICPLQPLMIQSSCFGSKSACSHSWLTFLQTWWCLYLTLGRTGIVTAPRRCKSDRIVWEDTQCIFELAQTYFYLNLGSTCWTHWTWHLATAPKVRSTKERSSSSKVCGRDIFIAPAIFFTVCPTLIQTILKAMRTVNLSVFKTGPAPLRCYIGGSFYLYLRNTFLSFGFPDLSTFMSLVPQNRESEVT